MNYLFQVGSFKSTTNANPTEYIVNTASLQDLSSIKVKSHTLWSQKEREPNTNTVVVLVRLKSSKL